MTIERELIIELKVENKALRARSNKLISKLNELVGEHLLYSNSINNHLKNENYGLAKLDDKHVTDLESEIQFTANIIDDIEKLIDYNGMTIELMRDSINETH